MKQLITTLLCLACLQSITAQSPKYEWVNASAGSIENLADMCADGSGNTYLAAGSIPLTTSSFTYAGNTISTAGGAIALIKSNAAGSVLWSLSTCAITKNGITGAISGLSNCTDNTGNMYLGAGFTGKSIVVGTSTFTNSSSFASYADAFITKYDPSGNFQWATNIGTGLYSENITAITCDKLGNVYALLNFSSPAISVGGNTFTNTSTFGSNFLVVKLNTSGTVLWAKQVIGQGETGISIVTDNDNDVYITGQYTGASVQFDGIILVKSTTSYYGAFLAKYSSEGAALWAKQPVNTPYNAIMQEVATDASGNIVLTGSFYGSLTLGDLTLTSNAGSFDMFLAKYDKGGNIEWTRSAGGNNTENGNGVSIDAAGTIVVAGSFSSTTLTLGDTTYSLKGSNNTFLARYDLSGALTWSDAFPSGTNFYENNLPVAIAAGNNGNTIIAGHFVNSITIGNTKVTAADTRNHFYVTNIGTEQAIVWKGSTSSSWFDATNWQPQQVPVDTNSILIPAGSIFYPSITSANAQCKDIKIENTATLSMIGGTLEIYGTVNAVSPSAFSLTGGTLKLYHGSSFPSGMQFNNLTLINRDDDVINNTYKIPGNVMINGDLKLTGSSSSSDIDLPIISLGLFDQFTLKKNFILDKGMIGIFNNLPEDHTSLPTLNFAGTNRQLIQCNNYNGILDASGVECNVKISNPLVSINSAYTIYMHNLILNQNLDLNGNNILVFGQIKYADGFNNTIMIKNAKPKKGGISIMGDPLWKMDNEVQYIKTEQLRSFRFNLFNKPLPNDTVVLVTSLTVDTLEVNGYLDLLGQDLTIGNTKSATGFLDCNKISASVAQGTLSLLGNNSCPEYKLVAKNLNNIVIDNPAGVALNNSVVLSPDDDLDYFSINLFGTALFRRGYFDMKETSILLVKDEPTSTINKGRIVEKETGGFWSSTNVEEPGPWVTMDTAAYSPLKNVNYGNMGFVISTEALLGYIIINLEKKFIFGNNHFVSIGKVYSVSNNSEPTNLNAQIKIKYLEADVFLQNESELGLYRRANDDPKGEWTYVPSVVNTVENTVTTLHGLYELDYSGDYFTGRTEYTLGSRLPAKKSITALPENSSLKNNPNGVASLAQNSPNPFVNSTTINYYLPANHGNAYINIYNVNGNIIRSVKLSGSGKGAITLRANEFTSGTYSYVLINDGKVIDSKQMISVK